MTLPAWAQSPVDAMAPTPARYALSGIVSGTTAQQELVTGPLPFDRSYAELTDEQKVALRSLYPSLLSGSEPPFPEEGFKPLSQALVDVSQRLRVPAHLVAVVNVDTTGHAKSLSVSESSDPSVTREVGLAMMKLKYKPGNCDDTPCEMTFPLRLDFAAAAGERGAEVKLGTQPSFDDLRTSPRRVAAPRN